MPALTHKYTNVKLSLTYDALTIHLNCKDDSTLLTQISKECHQTVCKNLLTSTLKEDAIESCLDQIEFKQSGMLKFDRFIFTDDDDHALYHQDKLNKNSPHCHIKLRSQLNKHLLTTLLDILVNHRLINEEEKLAFLNAFDQRYIKSRENLDEILAEIETPTDLELKKENPSKKVLHAKAIAQFVHACTDNDIIVDLHRYLLSSKFDYLRVIGKVSCLGSNANGKIIKTSTTWAWLEKTLSLQLAQNIKDKCEFTYDLARSRAKQLSVHRFFGISRYDSSEPCSPTLRAFVRADSKTFDERYESHFSLCSKKAY